MQGYSINYTVVESQTGHIKKLFMGNIPGQIKIKWNKPIKDLSYIWECLHNLVLLWQRPL